MKFVKRALIRITLWLAVTGLIAYFYTLQFKSEERCETTPVGHLAGKNFDRLWFEPNHDFAAIQREGGTLSIWVMPAEPPRVPTAKPEPELRSRFIPLPSTAMYAVAPNASQMVHSDGTTLTLQKVFGTWPEAPLQKELEPEHAPVRLAMLEGGLAAVATANGTVELLYTKDLKTAGSRALPVQNPDVLEATGPFLLAASHTTSEAWVLDSRTLPKIALIEYLKFPPNTSVLTLTKNGRLTVGTLHGEVIAGAGLTAPGPVKFLQPFGDRDYLVAGDFKGVYWIGPAGPSREVFSAGPGLRKFAASDSNLAFATQDAVEVLSMHFVPAVSPKVTDVIRIWILISLIVIAAFVLEGAILMYMAWRDGEGGQGFRDAGVTKVSGKLLPTLETFNPPDELIQSLGEGNCLLWAGEELSAKSGMPGWNSFVHGLLQWVEELQLMDATQSAAVALQDSQGEVDAVADSLLKLMENRPALLAEYVRSIYMRMGSLSGVHELLAAASFSGALTANLDSLLEKTFATRSPSLYLPAESVEAHSALVKHQFFVMKLRGACEFPESVVLKPAAAAAALRAEPQYRELRKEIFDTQVVLFVGLSVAELQLWLAGAEPGRPGRRHYALTPVSGTGWEKLASRLGKKYSIQIVTYPVDDTRPLRTFLENLIAAQQKRAAGAASH